MKFVKPNPPRCFICNAEVKNMLGDGMAMVNGHAYYFCVRDTRAVLGEYVKNFQDVAEESERMLADGNKAIATANRLGFVK